MPSLNRKDATAESFARTYGNTAHSALAVKCIALLRSNLVIRISNFSTYLKYRRP
jgi:hypothetical protein